MTKESKPDAWRPQRKVVRGSTLRIEIEIGTFLGYTMALSCRDEGELIRLLVAEAVGEDAPPASNAAVQRAYDQRDLYRVIKGAFGRAGLPLAVRKAVFERDGRRCSYCGSDLDWRDYHCDHVEPVAKGGSDAMDNLRASCRPCNLSKKDKLLVEWAR